jgi:hypothetical protein
MSAIAMNPRIVPAAGIRSAQGRRPAPGWGGAGEHRNAQVRRGAGVHRDAVAEPAQLRLTVRGRVVVVLLALLVVLGGVMGGRAVADGPEQAREVTTHSVLSGETLWQIAAEVAAPGEDVRDVILRLQELNDLPDSSLQAGQILLLPAES